MEVQESVFSFDKYLLIIKRRWIPALATFCPVFLISLLAFYFLKKPAYLAEGKLRFQRTNTTSILTGVGTEIGRLEPLVEDSRNNPLYTEAEVIRSTPIVQEIINQLNLTDNKKTPLKTKEFLKRLTVTDMKGADVLQISYRDTEPTIAAQVVNTLMAVYLENNVSTHRKQAAYARRFIQKQLPNAELIVRQAEAELAQFKEKYKVVSLQEEATTGVEVIAQLQQQINQAQSQLANAEAQSQDIRRRLGMNSQQATITTSLSQTLGIQDILREIQQLESRLASRRTVLQENHPEILDLQDKLRSLNRLQQQRVKQVAATTQPQLNQNLQLGGLQQQLSAKLIELESTRVGLVSQAAALFNLQTNYRERLNNLPRLEQQQRQLERKVQAAQSTYSLLLQKLEESRIAENQNLGNASIISKAIVPEEPSSSPVVIYLSAGLIATLTALTTICLLEATDKSIKTVDEAKDLLGFTVLGLIPSFSYSKTSLRKKEEPEIYSERLVIRDFPRSPISEAYRMLRANLKFISADKDLKVIVVTSSVPREGKSTVAANLAMAMAQMECKVLLIDGDLHRPVQHKIWELINNQGLTNVIVGEAEIKTAIQTVINNLDVLTAGVVPPSPASLLDSRKMAKLIENFATTYDFVIIDAPSLIVAADAATLGQMADGVLLVVRPGVVDSVNATIAIELLEQSGQNVLGQVINGVIPKNEPHSYYYFLEEYYSQDSYDLQQKIH